MDLFYPCGCVVDDITELCAAHGTVVEKVEAVVKPAPVNPTELAVEAPKPTPSTTFRPR